MKKIVSTVIAVGLVCFIIALGIALWPTTVRPVSADQTKLNTPEMIGKGQYLAVVGDCAACHTRTKNGEPFAGGDAISSPIGAMYPPNITPDKATGIGNYSLADFARAVRNGIRIDGDTLYPSMPYPSYVRLTDDDVAALYAYFQYGVKPVSAQTVRNDIPWPLSIRWPVAIWRKAFAPEDVAFDPKAYSDAAIARGAYIVQGLGHCGSCHTPRAITLQEKALSEKDPVYLSGGQVIDGWVAINLHADADGMKNWTADDIVGSLKTGQNDKGVVIGTPMNAEIIRSSSKWNDSDLQAVAAYIKTLPASAAQAAVTPAKASTDAQFNYQGKCQKCHGSQGEGRPGTAPPLAANPTVLSSNPQSVIRIVMMGFTEPQINPGDWPMSMPHFYDKLSDKEVADVVNHIRSNWGNQASGVAADDIVKYRPETAAAKGP